MPHVTLHMILNVVVYWGAFWNAIYFLAPPREYFHSPGYNKFLDLVSYYGALNIRGIVMKFYGAQPSEAPVRQEVVANVKTVMTVTPVDPGQPETKTTTSTPISGPAAEKKET